MQKIRSLTWSTCSLILISLLLTACGSVQFPGVYQVRIEQGNVITQEMIDDLKPGMTKEQVEFVMGSALVKDTFNKDRWDYIYTIKRGDRVFKNERLTIYFENDTLAYFTGDFVPSSANPDNTTEPEIDKELEIKNKDDLIDGDF